MRLELLDKPDNAVSELDFNVDAFHQQKILKGVYAFARNFDRLIRMRKRSNPSNPDMGVDLLSYRFSDIDRNVIAIKKSIEEQSSTYIPNAPIESIDVSTINIKGSYVLYIKVKLYISNEEITFGYYQKEGNLISTKITVTKPKFINTKGRRT